MRKINNKMNTADYNEAVLKLLKKADGYISGENIAKKLNISRTGVWKHVEKLKKEGFSINSSPGKGYLLLSTPDKLIPAEIKDGLATSTMGQTIYYYKETESTNLIAKKLAMEGTPDGSIVVAEEQTKGRGRLAREWISPSCKNILMSVILFPKIQPPQIFSTTMLASLAIVKGIEQTTGLKAMIKWPNDIYINWKKTAGILTEFNAQQDMVSYVVIGIGINVNFDPATYPEIKDISTSLFKELGKKVSRVNLLQSILEEMEKGYLLIKQGNFSEIHSQWNRYSLVNNMPVEIRSFDTVEKGVAESVNLDGSLNLRDQQGKIKKIICGDLSLRFRR